MEENKEKNIKKIIDDIRPYLNEDGGDIEYVKLDENYVFIKLFGACVHCGSQDTTINYGILRIIQEKYPEIEGVINVEFQKILKKNNYFEKFVDYFFVSML